MYVFGVKYLINHWLTEHVATIYLVLSRVTLHDDIVMSDWFFEDIEPNNKFKISKMMNSIAK